MRRGILLILALLLVIDLADDGCLGKVKIVPLHSTAKTTLTSPSHSNHGEVDLSDTLPSPDGAGARGWNKFQAVILRVNQAIKIVLFCNKGSSGGIPL